MAYTFSAARMEIASAVVTAYPFTMACWGYVTSLSSTANRTAMCIGPASSAAAQQSLGFGLTNSPGPGIYAQSEASGVTSTAFSTTAPTANTWHHLCGVFTSDTDRAAFIDGGSKGTDATSRTFAAALNRTVIGQRLRSNTYGVNMVGRLAECCIWDVALNDDEVASLGKGYRPTLIRPGNLVMYVPIVREVADYVGSNAITQTGTLTVVEHSRRIA